MKKISMLIVALLVAVASHAQFEQGNGMSVPQCQVLI